MSDQWMMAMTKAIEVVDNKAASLDAMTQRYSAMLDAAIGRMSGTRMEPVAAPQMPTAPNIVAPPRIPQDGPDDFPEGADLEIREPSPIDIGSLLADLDVSDLEIPPAPELVTVQIPTAPTMASITAPVRPTIDTNVEMPLAPVITEPVLDALVPIVIPPFEFPLLPDFNGTPPEIGGITVPSPILNWAEPQYQSELLPELMASVKAMMAGGTGLPAAVEDALFSRARERDSAETARAVQEAVDTWAARGFSMPPGMLVKQASVVREQGRLKAAELNRDILVEAAKWEIENIRFAVQQGMALEQLLSNIFENAAKRMFEAARFHAEAQINVFNAQISLFNAQSAAFKTTADVYRTQLDGALAKLTAYKAAIEGQQAIGQLNQQAVEIYKARISAVQSSVEVFKALMQGAQVRAETIKSQFDAYRADVQAYAEQIGAEKVKFDAFESQVKGEQARAGVFEANARAYASTVQAIASRADVKIKGGQLKIEAARVKVAEFAANLDAQKMVVDAKLKQVQAKTGAYSAKVDGWRAASMAITADNELQSRYADMIARTNLAFSEAQRGMYQASIQKAASEAQIIMEGNKASGQYTAQLAAGALSALHVSASVQGTGTQSGTYTQTKSEGMNTNHNYNY